MTKLKVGDKVKVINKIKISFGEIGVIEMIENVAILPILVHLENGLDAWYNQNDIELIKDKNVKGVSKNPRHFRLLKDLPCVETGTLYEKIVDFYYPIENVFGTLDNFNRLIPEIVENNPEWFEEILEEPKKESKEIEKLQIDIGVSTLSNDYKLATKINELVLQVNKLSKEK